MLATLSIQIFLFLLGGFVCQFSAVAAQNMTNAPIFYLIRHGEKPANGSDGLSAQGMERAQALVQVFGKNSSYNIGYIVAEKPKKDGSRERPLETVTPLANSLNLTINDSISKTDAAGVAAAVKAYNGTGNVLVCWEHHELTDIAEAIGVENAPEYPDDRFDIIWTVESPYTEIDSVTSEDVMGLDS